MRYVGAVPVFADVRADTGTIGPLAVADLVDPLLSTGVTLATLAASALSGIVDAILEHPEIEDKALERYAATYRRFFDEIRVFIGKFYGWSKTKEFYWGTTPRRSVTRSVSSLRVWTSSSWPRG